MVSRALGDPELGIGRRSRLIVLMATVGDLMQLKGDTG